VCKLALIALTHLHRQIYQMSQKQIQNKLLKVNKLLQFSNVYTTNYLLVSLKR